MSQCRWGHGVGRGCRLWAAPCGLRAAIRPGKRRECRHHGDETACMGALPPLKNSCLGPLGFLRSREAGTVPVRAWPPPSTPVSHETPLGVKPGGQGCGPRTGMIVSRLGWRHPGEAADPLAVWRLWIRSLKGFPFPTPGNVTGLWGPGLGTEVGVPCGPQLSPRAAHIVGQGLRTGR